MQKEITLIDRGRGLQLSTSRITVHDLVPYFQNRCSYDEITRWLPSLTHEEIAIVERYYRQLKWTPKGGPLRLPAFVKRSVTESLCKFVT